MPLQACAKSTEQPATLSLAGGPAIPEEGALALENVGYIRLLAYSIAHSVPSVPLSLFYPSAGARRHRLRRLAPVRVRLEAQSCRVDAVAQAGGVRSVVETMAEVTVTSTTSDFGADHVHGSVFVELDCGGTDRLVKARPPGARIVLRTGAEQRLPASGATIESRCFISVIRTGKRTLRSPLA